jgi:CRISPR-associated protein Cas2
MMLVLVTYDVNTESEEGRRRLRRVARRCENRGQRVQKSVFECLVDAAQWTAFRAALIGEIEDTKDSLRFYFLGDNWKPRIEHVGAKPSYDPQGPLIV